jgi:hypothetical protein
VCIHKDESACVVSVSDVLCSSQKNTYIVSVVGPGPSLIRLRVCHPITANGLY